jgi:hypothetical protein
LFSRAPYAEPRVGVVCVFASRTAACSHPEVSRACVCDAQRARTHARAVHAHILTRAGCARACVRIVCMHARARAHTPASAHTRAHTRARSLSSVRCVRACMRACACTHSSTPSCERTRTSTHTPTLTHTHGRAHVSVLCARTRVLCVCARACVRVHTHTSTLSRMRAHTCACARTHTEPHTHAHTHTHTHRHPHLHARPLGVSACAAVPVWRHRAVFAINSISISVRGILVRCTGTFTSTPYPGRCPRRSRRSPTSLSCAPPRALLLALRRHAYPTDARSSRFARWAGGGAARRAAMRTRACGDE